MVIRATGLWCRVMGDGKVYNCRLRGSYRLRGSKQTNPVAVGDYVEYELQDDGTGVVTDVCDRRNYIVRRATKLSKQTHVIAANIDLMCIVATVEHPRTSTGFVDRLLATAEAYGIETCLIYNKCDLYDNNTLQKFNTLKEVYNNVGYKVYSVSATQNVGIQELRATIQGKTVLFCGHSGSGKSSLLNAIDSSLHLKVGEVSEWSDKGTHTTTFAEMFPFANGYIIDTPGIKEFGMVDFKENDLSHYFPEMRALQSRCRFANCTHRHEPGCAVIQAAEEGLVAPERYKNYLSILDGLTT